MSYNITVVYGSVRPERQGIKAANWIVKELENRGHSVTLIDPLELKLPFLERKYAEYEAGKTPEKLVQLADIFTKTDAFVIVSAEYNHGLPPALKNILDHFWYDEYQYKTAAIITYSNGDFGGIRVTEKWREVLADFRLITIPAIMPIVRIQDVFTDDGKLTDEAYNKRFSKLANQLEWYTEALNNQKTKGLPE